MKNFLLKRASHINWTLAIYIVCGLKVFQTFYLTETSRMCVSNNVVSHGSLHCLDGRILIDNFPFYTVENRTDTTRDNSYTCSNWTIGTEIADNSVVYDTLINFCSYKTKCNLANWLIYGSNGKQWFSDIDFTCFSPSKGIVNK